MYTIFKYKSQSPTKRDTAFGPYSQRMPISPFPGSPVDALRIAGSLPATAPEPSMPVASSLPTSDVSSKTLSPYVDIAASNEEEKLLHSFGWQPDLEPEPISDEEREDFFLKHSHKRNSSLATTDSDSDTFSRGMESSPSPPSHSLPRDGTPSPPSLLLPAATYAGQQAQARSFSSVLQSTMFATPNVASHMPPPSHHHTHTHTSHAQSHQPHTPIVLAYGSKSVPISDASASDDDNIFDLPNRGLTRGSFRRTMASGLIPPPPPSGSSSVGVGGVGVGVGVGLSAAVHLSGKPLHPRGGFRPYAHSQASPVLRAGKASVSTPSLAQLGNLSLNTVEAKEPVLAPHADVPTVPAPASTPSLSLAFSSVSATSQSQSSLAHSQRERERERERDDQRMLKHFEHSQFS